MALLGEKNHGALYHFMTIREEYEVSKYYAVTLQGIGETSQRTSHGVAY